MRSVLNGVLWQYLSDPVRLFLSTSVGASSLVWWITYLALFLRISAGDSSLVWESRFSCGSPDIVSWWLVDGLESRFSCGSPDIVSWSLVDGLESRFSCGSPDIVSWWPIVGLRGRSILLLFFCTDNLTPVWEIVLGCRYKYISTLRYSNKDVCGSRVIELL